MRSHDSLGRKVSREIKRAMFERAQSMDVNSMMKFFGAPEPAVYEDVEEIPSVAYLNRGEVPLAMDIFRPEGSEGRELPVIIAVHGGGLFLGDRGLERPYCRMLAHKGYLVFSIEYRLAPKADLCQQLDDVCAGMDTVGRILVHFDVDFSRIFLVADSAGAYLGAYAAAMHDSKKLQDAIGYEPSKMTFAAVGFICGMFYINKTLQEQIYGDRRLDKKFLEYMDIEHPEIIGNMPPAFLITSCGDTFNNYSLRFNRALQKGGRTSKLIYFGDEALQHIFPITNPEHPRSLEATDRMLTWFEEQAAIRHESRKKTPETVRRLGKVNARLKDGSISSQKVWAYVKERIGADDGLMNRTALIDCTREYTYRQMFGEWERYAGAFSALGVCAENGSRAALCGVIAAEPLFALFGLNMTGAEVSLLPNQVFRPNGMWKDMLAKEKVTDLIVSDILVTPEIREELEAAKEELGLRSVIYVHSRLGGPTVGPAELTYNEYNYHLLKGRAGSVFMNDLIVQHADAPIRYDESAGDRTAFSVLSPDAAQGAHRPLRLTDRMFNDMLNRLPKGYHPFAKGSDAARPFRVVQTFDFGSGFSLLAQTVSTLAAGDTLVTTFFGAAHPKFLRAIGYYYVSVMTVTGPVMDSWLAGGACGGIKLSSLQVVGMCGEDAEPGKMEAYQRFLEDRGCRCGILPAGKMIGAQGKNLPGFEDGPGAACVQGENGKACGVFDLLRAAGPAKKPAGFSLPDPFGLIRKTVPDKGEEKKEFQIPEGLRAAFMKYGNRLSGIMSGRKWMNFDFEE